MDILQGPNSVTMTPCCSPKPFSPKSLLRFMCVYCNVQREGEGGRKTGGVGVMKDKELKLEDF